MTTLDTLRQLQAEATPGPWEVEPWPDGAPDADVVAPHRDSAGNRKGFTYIAEGLTPANARVAAAAPTHLTDLITALEREAKVRELHKAEAVVPWVGAEARDFCLSDGHPHPCPTIRILDGNE